MTSTLYTKSASAQHATPRRFRAEQLGRAIRTLLTGPTDAPRGARPALLALLLATTLLYTWNLGDSGWANTFYSAAVQAGSESWKAFFFGSSDAANFITVDKPPASLWVMELSARIFGVNAWSMLVPQALEGVAAVGLLYAAVRRWHGYGAGLIAGAILALTPVAALMFRFNNPDALLMLLLVAAGYALVRAIEGASTKWLLLVGVFIGFGFLTKMLQAFLVVPGFAIAYLIAAPTTFGRRIKQTLLGGAALLVSAGWWVALVELVPSSMRPYIGGSENNSILNLIFGYNGFGRLTGNESGSVGGGGQTGSRWGETGWLRMFNAEMGGQASWLLPSALFLIVMAAALTIRAKRTDRTRAAIIMWGGWLLVTTITFSLGQGIIHPYYTVALAPAIGAVVGIGATELWRRRDEVVGRLGMAATIAIAAVWSYRLLDRSPSWHPWLRWIVLVGGMAVVLALLFGPHLKRGFAITVVATALAVTLAGPAAYSLNTATTPHSGSLPTAGPTVAGARGMGGGPNGFGGGTMTGFGNAGTGTGTRAGAGAGGLLSGSTASAELTALLQANADDYTWVAAVARSNQAAGYQLASGQPVMAIGGFNGTDAAPTLAEFQQYVSEGKVHYFIAGDSGSFGGGGGMGGSDTSSTASEISTWVTQNFASQTIDNVTIYDLSSTQSTSN